MAPRHTSSPDFTLLPLEPRRLCSASAGSIDTVASAEMKAALMASHQHFHTRHHYHSPHKHTVSRDALFGHWVGTASGVLVLAKKVELTIGKDGAGKLNGLLLLDGFSFDTDLRLGAYSDGTFSLLIFGKGRFAGIGGTIIRRGHRTVGLTGNFLDIFGGGGPSGQFALTKT